MQRRDVRLSGIRLYSARAASSLLGALALAGATLAVAAARAAAMGRPDGKAPSVWAVCREPTARAIARTMLATWHTAQHAPSCSAHPVQASFFAAQQVQSGPQVQPPGGHLHSSLQTCRGAWSGRRHRRVGAVRGRQGAGGSPQGEAPHPPPASAAAHRARHVRLGVRLRPGLVRHVRGGGVRREVRTR